MDETPGTSSDTSNEIGLPSEDDPVKSKYKSNIWDHFILSKQSGKSFGKCKYCNKTLKSEYGSTTGLIRHLQGKHYAKYLIFQKAQDDMKRMKEQEQSRIRPITSTRPNTEPLRQSQLGDFDKWESTNAKAKAITNEVGKWMAASLHPYSLVEEVGLKNVLNLAQPKYNLPSRNTFSRSIIPSLFKEVQGKIKHRIDEQKSSMASMSLTLDMWTSRANNSFLAVTSHFMSNEFKIENMCLGCYSLPGEHTGQNIFDKLTSSLQEWELDKMKIPIYIITDNAKNIKHAMSLHTTGITSLNCFAHTLQLALRDAKAQTPGMTDLTAKVRKVVGHYKHSSKATDRLHNIQKDMGKPELQMIQDCDTRWNSEYLMLSRLLTNKEALSRDIAETGQFDNLTLSEWKLAQGYVDILAPVYQATTEICSATIPTCSMVVPIVHCIVEKLDQYKTEPFGTGKMFAANFLKCMKSRFPNKQKTEPYMTAMLLDPRFKDIVLEEECERAMAHVNLKKVIMKYAGKHTDESSSDTKQTETKKNMDKKSLWSIFDKAAAKRAETSSHRQNDMESKIDEEMKIFFDETCIPHKADPCCWWEQNKDRFRFLQQAAKQYLGIPSTEVASERTFSSAGNVVTDVRETLTPEHVEELVFLHQNKHLYL